MQDKRLREEQWQLVLTGLAAAIEDGPGAIIEERRLFWLRVTREDKLSFLFVVETARWHYGPIGVREGYARMAWTEEGSGSMLGAQNIESIRYLIKARIDRYKSALAAGIQESLF